MPALTEDGRAKVNLTLGWLDAASMAIMTSKAWWRSPIAPTA